MNSLSKRQILASVNVCRIADTTPSQTTYGAARAVTGHAFCTASIKVVQTLVTAIAIALALPLSPPTAAAPANRPGFVYTADENGNTVSRIDLETETVDILPVGITPHNVQFVPGNSLLLAVGLPLKDAGEGQHGNGHTAAEGKLVIIDTAAFPAGPVASIAVGGHPAHVIADTQGRFAYVSNSEDDTVSVVDLDKREAVATITTGDYPHGLRISPDGKAIYVANVQDGTVSVLDPITRTETDRVAVGAAPVQVGFTPDGSRVYVSLRDDDKVAVINTATRKVIARIDVGRSPIQVHATPDGRFVYVANQGTEAEPDETASVIDIASGSVAVTILTGKGAHGVTVSNDGASAFVSNILAGTVSEISIAGQSVVRTYNVGKGPNGITYQAR
ncbi:MAG: cytochrome D1 domain-containing protein [Pseudomonadota bacterium]